MRAKFEKSKGRVMMCERNEVVYKRDIIIFEYSKIKGRNLSMNDIERHRKVKFQ